MADLQRKYSFLKPSVVRRLFRAYGANIDRLLENARFASDMGKSFGPLSEREINYLRAEEWALTADDILWRRSKLGLHLSAAEQADLRAFMKPAAKPSPAKKAVAAKKRARR